MNVSEGRDRGGVRVLSHVCPARPGHRGIQHAIDASHGSEEEGSKEHGLHHLGPKFTYKSDHFCK